MDKQELYEKWVDKVCQYIESVGPEINCTPQFRSIILCNLLLYIDVIFWD